MQKGSKYCERGKKSHSSLHDKAEAAHYSQMYDGNKRNLGKCYVHLLSFSLSLCFMAEDEFSHAFKLYTASLKQRFSSAFSTRK